MGFQITPNMQDIDRDIVRRKTATLWPKNIIRIIS